MPAPASWVVKVLSDLKLVYYIALSCLQHRYLFPLEHLLMPPSFHLLAHPGHFSRYSFNTAASWEPSAIIPDWYRYLSLLLAAFLLRTVIKLCAIGAIIA